MLLQDFSIQLAFADAMGRRLREDRTKDGDDPDAIEQDVARSRARITRAPVVLVVCVTMTSMPMRAERAQNS
jgi:coenzyme F420-0:L-glutamate ligase / coenzyme F420-1:gamma-L-glutamate ligase